MRILFCALALAAAGHATRARAELADQYAFQAEVSKVGAGEQLRRYLWSLAGPDRAVADLTVTVRDEEGRALAGANVLVGSRAGAPFRGNQAVTNAGGLVGFTDASLRAGTIPAVTVWKEGYGAFTLAAPAGGEISVTLPKNEEPAFSFVEGRVSGFAAGYGSSQLELGVFLPAFRPQSLLNFDPQQFVSSYVTKINVFGEREVPGNVVLPTQRKRYGIIPISLSKPDYVMPLEQGLSARFAALSGAVTIGDALGAIQKNDFLGAINLASFGRVTWTQSAVTVAGNQRLDLTLDQEITPKAARASLAGLPGSYDVVAVALADPNGGRADFIPLDVKAVKAEAVQNGGAAVELGLLRQRRPEDGYYVFAGLFDRGQLNPGASSRWIVGSLQAVNLPAGSARFEGFLNPVKAGTVSADQRAYRFDAPSSANVRPDLVLVNIVSEKKNAETRGTSRRVLWSAVLPGSATSLNLPDLGQPVLPKPDQSRGESFRWEVIAVKASLPAGSDIQSVLRNLQHVSSLSQKF